MFKIYTSTEAQKSILVRKPVLLADYPESVLKGTARLFGEGVTPEQAVRQILKSILAEGDAAVERWSRLLDRKAPAQLQIDPARLPAAWESLDANLKDVLRLSAERIRKFHTFQPLPNWETTELGGRLGQRCVPVDRVGVYVPGGSAPLPSSLLMSVIPAQVAGAQEIIVCTPPDPHPSILAAAHLCGIDRIYEIGGAQAIGAMAFGTATIPKVDVIVGPGNLWVTLAKQQVYGVVGLDGLAGPTETMVIADHTANPAWIAADLLAQAEHDTLASAILLTTDRKLAEAVQVEAARQMESLSRTDILSQSIPGQGGLVIVESLAEAAELANQYAAEHLCVSVETPAALLPLLRHAGGIFLGEYSFEVLGDYIAGPSHVMPTGGSARWASPLNVMNFVKITSMVELDDQSGQTLSRSAANFARLEQLTAHAAAADFRKGAE